MAGQQKKKVDGVKSLYYFKPWPTNIWTFSLAIYENIKVEVKMNTKSELTWKDAVFESPGPKTVRQFVLLIIKGLFMGIAHIIPGVSGGTIALISGIYLEFLDAVKSANTDFLTKLASFKIKEAVSILHIRFLSAVFLGTIAAVVTLAQVASYLLSTQPVATGSFFMGLIVASAFLVGKDIKNWAGSGGIGFVAGTAIAYFVVGMMPAATPEALWFVFLAGAISICAMILPGLSGAFVLLVLGKYAYIVDAIKNPFSVEHIMIVLVFCAGCAAGLAGFSRALSYLLKKYYNVTLAVLTGLMTGSLRKIWPWKETLDTKIIHGKTYIVSEKNLLPSEMNAELIIAGLLCLTGFIMIVFLEKMSDNGD